MDIKEDLYEAVNREELNKIEIPDDKPMFGNFTKIDQDVESLLMADLKKMSKGEIELTNLFQKQMIKFYNLAFDFEKRNKQGWEGFKKHISIYDELKTFNDFQEFFVAELLAILPFGLYVGADMKNTTKNVLYLYTPKTFLPDKTYYEENHPNGKELLKVLKNQLNNLMEDFGYSEKIRFKLIEDAFEYDFQFKTYTKTSTENADYVAGYNPLNINELNSYSDFFDFKLFLNNILNKEIDSVIVDNLIFFENLNNFFNPSNFEKIKAWMIVNEFLENSAMLSEKIREMGSAYSKTITGNPKISNPERHAYKLVETNFSSVVGDYYGKKYFGQEAKEDIMNIVKSIIKTYRKRLKRNNWLSQETIDKAIAKLNKIEILIGYPEKIKEVYKQIEVDTTKTLFENIKMIDLIFTKNNLAKYGKAVDRSEWSMSANTVNAYYHPFNNLICFPAAILQAPFYNYKQSISKNFGGIGAVIAHEISHAFDNNGSKFDEYGNLNNWWLDKDFIAFEFKAKRMIELWNELQINGNKVNGELTVSENIADLGGLSCALEALKEFDKYNLQEFFENWARIWCLKIRPEFEKLLLQVDTHSPARLRANITVRHLNEFYETFKVESGDKMFLDEDKRIEIW